MKDEEMAKEWFDKELYLESSMYNMQIEYYCKQAFLAGLKAGRAQAKELIKEMLPYMPKENIEGVYEIVTHAEEFIKEIEK